MARTLRFVSRAHVSLAVLLVLAAGTCATAADSAQAAAPSYRPGIVIVGFRPGVTPAQRRTVQRAAWAQSAHPLGIAAGSVGSVDAGLRLRRRLGSRFTLRVPASRVMAAVRLLRRYRRLVRFAEPDYLLRASAAQRLPNDPLFSQQWGSLNTGQSVNGSTGAVGADGGAAAAWRVTTGSRSIVIADVDTGVEYTHPDLAANMWSNPGGVGGCPSGTHGYNVLAATCDPMDDDTSYGGHGTHVAGIIGAVGNNGVGVAGMNWQTAILAVKWLDSGGGGSTDQLINALDWVVRAKRAGVNVRVVNDSATFVGTAYSQALSDEIDLLGANGILFVTAAGNTGQDNDNPASPRYPCDYGRPTELCVTTTDQNDHQPSWADWGAHTVDLAAPGNDVYSTLRNGTYGFISGGSMAAAEVSGAAGLILSRANMSPTALKADILLNVDPRPSLSGRVRTGGRLDVCKAISGCASGPRVKSFSISPARVIIRMKDRRRRTKGTTFRFTLDQAASVLIVVQRGVVGRSSHGRCRAATGHARAGRHCTLYLKVATIRDWKVASGVSHKWWDARQGKVALAAGSYRAVIHASSRYGNSRPRSVRFSVVDIVAPR
jgi:thermitase